MADYANDVLDAQAALKADGAAAFISRAGVSYPCSIVIDKFTTLERATSLISHGDQKIYVAAGDLGFVPNPETDRLIVGVDNLRIVTCDRIAPGNIDILYLLQVRK